MMKVAFRNAEYNASLPPYRFQPGDVVEIEDDWAKQMIQRGIAIKAKDSAKTVLEQRLDARPAPADDGGAQARAERRAALQAELAALDRADAPTPFSGGHYSDMVTRADVAGEDPDDKPATDTPADGGKADEKPTADPKKSERR